MLFLFNSICDILNPDLEIHSILALIHSISGTGSRMKCAGYWYINFPAFWELPKPPSYYVFSVGLPKFPSYG